MRWHACSAGSKEFRTTHHAGYPEEIVDAAPLAGLRSPGPFIEAVEHAGWRRVRLYRLRDVEWAIERRSPWPLGWGSCGGRATRSSRTSNSRPGAARLGEPRVASVREHDVLARRQQRANGLGDSTAIWGLGERGDEADRQDAIHDAGPRRPVPVRERGARRRCPRPSLGERFQPLHGAVARRVAPVGLDQFRQRRDPRLIIVTDVPDQPQRGSGGTRASSSSARGPSNQWNAWAATAASIELARIGRRSAVAPRPRALGATDRAIDDLRRLVPGRGCGRASV